MNTQSATVELAGRQHEYDHHPTGMVWITTKIEANSAKRVLHNDTEHIVAEVVAARAMQLNGGYVPADEFRESVPDWEHVPLPIGHPVDTNGRYISARLPEVIEHASVGHFQHVDFDEETDELTGEVWINVPKAEKLGDYGQRVVELIENGEPLEVSTAYRADHGASGVYDGEFRETVRTNLRPDHLALLPDDLGPGKCSVEDGCGVHADAEPDATDEGSINVDTDVDVDAEPVTNEEFAAHFGDAFPADEWLTVADRMMATHNDVRSLMTALVEHDQATANADEESKSDADYALPGASPFNALLPASGTVINAGTAADAPRVCVNTDTDLAELTTDDNDNDDPAELEADARVSLAQRILSELGLSAPSLTPRSHNDDTAIETDTDTDQDQDTDQDCEPCRKDDLTHTDPATDTDTPESSVAEDPGEATADTATDKTTNIHMDLNEIADATDFSVEELESLDESIVSKLVDTLTNEDCECNDHNDHDGCDGCHNEAPEEPEPEAPEAPTVSDETEEAEEDTGPVHDPRVDDVIDTVNELANTVNHIAETVNAEENEKRSGLIEDILSNSDVYAEGELEEMKTSTLESTHSLVVTDDEEMDANSGAPSLPSGTDLSALAPTKSVGNSETDKDDLPSAGSLADYRKNHADD